MSGERDPAYAASPNNCNTFWGSHGCDLAYRHDGPCRCGTAEDPCSTYEPGVGVRFHHLGRAPDELSAPIPDYAAWGDNAPTLHWERRP